MFHQIVTCIYITRDAKLNKDNIAVVFDSDLQYVMRFQVVPNLFFASR